MESVEPINVVNLRVNQQSQINEDTIEPSLAAQDINPIAYMPDLILHLASDLVQLIRPVHVYLA